jgi:anthranilate phosphoribosyltransferase
MKRWLQELARGKTGARDLSYDEALSAASQLLDGLASEAQMGALLTALRLKSETPEELAAFIQALRQRAQPLALESAPAAKTVAVAGGSEGRESFNASLGASLLCAQAGLPMLLLAAEPLPPREGVGQAALLRSFGLQRGLADEPAQAVEDLQRFNLGLLDSEAWCPALGALRRLRQDLGVRTVLHAAERFLKPLGAAQLLVGVQNAPALERARALGARLGAERVMVVQGLDGSEDLPTHRPAQALLIESGVARSLSLDAAELGLSSPPRRGLSLEEQRGRLAQVLGGEGSQLVEAERRQVLWNTAVRLWAFGRALSLGEGLELAEELLRSGKGLTLLLRWARATASPRLEVRP